LLLQRDVRWLWLVSVLPIAACDLDLSFESDGTSVHATGRDDHSIDVSICAGPSGLLDCNQDNDAFAVTADGVTEQASAGFLSFGGLDATFDVNAADLAITVTRQDGATGTVTLPPLFDLTGPSGPVARGDRVALAWQPGSTDAMTWTANVSCPSNGADSISEPRTIADDGRLEISASELPKPGSGACSASLALTRSRRGTMAAPYPSDSTIAGEQTRAIAFELDD